MSLIPARFIKNKREGLTHSPEEITSFIQQFLDGEVTDYQMSAWLMTIFFQGASPMETATLTRVMRDSGTTLNFNSENKSYVDKHSTGGIGDKTSLILAPIVAVSGISVPMIAGRGLGHTGGTLDKLESIPGFRTRLTKEEIETQVQEINLAIVGQTSDICPVDQRLYALRDVTATIDSCPLICASIMSKKLAEQLNALVLDVKFGSGAFMKNLKQAKELANLLIHSGESNNVQTRALLTNMNQPLGRYIGNSLEVKECLDILMGKPCIENGVDFYKDTKMLSLHLAGHMIYMGKKASSLEEGITKANEILSSGEAHKKFLKLCEHQGPCQIDKLPLTDKVYEVPSPHHGFVQQIDAEKLGWMALELGAGRRSAHEKIDPSAGIEWCCKVGQEIKEGQVIARVYCQHAQKAEKVRDNIANVITLGSSPCPPITIIAETLTGESLSS